MNSKPFSMGSFQFSIIAMITAFLLSALRPNMGQQYYSATPSNIYFPACKASRDPESCQSLVNQSGHVPPGGTVHQVISSLLNFTLRNLDSVESHLNHILHNSGGNQNLTKAANSSLLLVQDSRYRVQMTSSDIQNGLSRRRDQVKDSRAWVSAALASNLGVLAAFKNLNATPEVAVVTALSNTTFIPSSRDALSMLANYDIFGDKIDSWAPLRTEREDFWEPVNAGRQSGSVLGVPKGLPHNATVCQDGGCTYKTVQEAVDAAPFSNNRAGRFVIWVKAGVYNETVRVIQDKPNVVLLGDGIGKTVITGCLNGGQPGMTTMQSATVAAVGDGFMARDITFENTAAVGAPAVAFRSEADRTVMESCEFRGNQDTLYAKALRQYYKSCKIVGNVDFIFGNAAAIFQDCEILIAPRPGGLPAAADNTITAHARLEGVMSTGFVFNNCSINGTEEYVELYGKEKKGMIKNYLGRPWREFSRTVFIECNYGGMIDEKGWFEWDGEFALKTLYYGEYGNTGTDTSHRVKWSNTVPADHVNSYSLSNFIQGDQWIH